MDQARQGRAVVRVQFGFGLDSRVYDFEQGTVPEVEDERIAEGMFQVGAEVQRLCRGMPGER